MQNNGLQGSVRPYNGPQSRFSLFIPVEHGTGRRSIAEILEGLRRWADHDITLRLDFEDREPALHEPARGKAEQPVNPGEPARIENRLLRKWLCVRAPRQYPGECRGIVAERRQARR